MEGSYSTLLTQERTDVQLASAGRLRECEARGRQRWVELSVVEVHSKARGALHLAQREMRRPVQLFNNRAIERLFQQFQSVKFFLARDNLREVIVRR